MGTIGECHAGPLVLQGQSDRPLGSAPPAILPIPNEMNCEPTNRVASLEPLHTSYPEYLSQRLPDYTQEGLIDPGCSNDYWEAIAGWSHRVAEEFDPGDVGGGSTQHSEVSDC